MTTYLPIDELAARTGLPRGFLATWLTPGAAVADRGEPSAAELALLNWPLTAAERLEFGRSVARIAGGLRDASDADLEEILARLNGARPAGTP